MVRLLHGEHLRVSDMNGLETRILKMIQHKGRASGEASKDPDLSWMDLHLLAPVSYGDCHWQGVEQAAAPKRSICAT